MKVQVWLRPNRRALLLGMILPGALAGAGLLAWQQAPWGWCRGLGAALAALGGLVLAALGWQMRQPRLAYGRGSLLVYLGRGAAEVVPIGTVECFFLGKGPVAEGGRSTERAQVANVVVRLAESAREYANRPVKPALGQWAGGYITLRGTWCEPLNLARVNQLNQWLREAQATAPRGESGVGP